MPAAAVIPAPIAYIKVVAVKKLVVGSAAEESGPPLGGYCFSWPNSPGFPLVLFIECHWWPERLL